VWVEPALPGYRSLHVASLYSLRHPKNRFYVRDAA
jgi:hypothetical protein